MLNKEGVLLKNLPNDIITAIINNETSLGNNPALPDIYETPFLIKIVNSRFKHLKEELKTIGSITDIKSDDLYTGLSELILKCKNIEKQFRPELEKICYNLIVDLFSIPEETVNLKIELKDNVDFSNTNIIIDPNEDSEEYEMQDINDAKNYKNELYKRRLLLSLCVGGAMEISKMFDIYESQISKISNELCDLYRNILTLNEYLLFVKEDIEITEENKKQLGTVEVYLGNEENKVTIKSQATIFPILLFETIRGFFELFISHGLPKDRDMALSLINKTDYLNSEPWNMRIGPSLWNLFFSSIDDIKTKELPYLLKKVSKLKYNKFNVLMNEIFAKTKKGKHILKILSNKSKNELDYNSFLKKMDKMKSNKSIITDEYIHFDEL